MAPLTLCRESARPPRLLDDGDVLVAGGSVSKQAELYDPDQNSWKPAGTMIYPCADAFATLVQNDDVLISGCDDQETDSANLDLAVRRKPSD